MESKVHFIGGAVGGAFLALVVVWSLLPPSPSSFDADDDGRISAFEYQSFNAWMFEQIDTDQSDSISAGELTAAISNLRPKLAQSIKIAFKFNLLDENGDGEVSRSEFLNETVQDSLFRERDKNGNGYLERGEGNEFVFDLLFPK